MRKRTATAETRKKLREAGRRGGLREPKISDEQRADIQRRFFAGESQKDMAKEFGVSRTHICHIVQGRRY